MRLFPFHEGVNAGRLGLDPRLCPYDKMTPEYWGWQRGHNWACEFLAAMCAEEEEPNYADARTTASEPQRGESNAV